jgi:hypothetical protein
VPAPPPPGPGGPPAATNEPVVIQPTSAPPGDGGRGRRIDGILRRLTERIWEGTSRGYRVQDFSCGGSWHFAIINGRGHVEICPPAASLATGARRARAWVGRNPVWSPPE